MAHSSSAVALAKPRAKLPLTERADGRWCKKVRGRMWYFTGSVEEAIDEWNRVKDAILAGDEPPPKDEAKGLTIADLCNQFLHVKAAERDEQKITETTWRHYRRIAKKLTTCWGKHRIAANLAPSDYRRLRGRLAKTCNLLTLSNTIVKVRVIFNFAIKERLLERTPHYGTAFELPDAAEKRKYRSRQEAANGKKMFDAAEVQSLIEGADVHLRAMIYLGINCGFGNYALGEVSRAAADGRRTFRATSDFARLCRHNLQSGDRKLCV